MSKKFLKAAGIFTGVFAVSFGAAFFAQYKPSQSSANTLLIDGDGTVRTVTDQQKVLNSLLEIQGFNVSGNLEMIAKDNASIGVSFNGQGDLSDLEDIKLQGSIDVALNESHLIANFGYFDEELFFDYNNSYFKLETTKLMDYVQLLPTYGINVELPFEIEEMDLTAIES